MKYVFLIFFGSYNEVTVCKYFTSLLQEKYNLVLNNTLQKCGDFIVFPTEYFCPYDDRTGVLSKTENTYAIHWYAKSWMPWHMVVRNKITRIFHRYFGIDCFTKVKKICAKKE